MDWRPRFAGIIGDIDAAVVADGDGGVLRCGDGIKIDEHVATP